MKSKTYPLIMTAGWQPPVVRKLLSQTVLLCFVFFSICGQVWSEDAPFFKAVNSDQLEKALISSEIVKRIRPVLPNMNKLTTLNQGELVLNFFDDVHMDITIAKQDRTIAGQALWQGTVTGVAHSYVLLVSNGETISGEIFGADFRFQIRPWQDEVHIVREMVKEQSSSPVVKVSGDAALEAEVTVLTNQERAANSLYPYSYDAKLTTSARGHATDMAVQNYFNHVSLDGRTLSQRVTAAGYVYNAVGENIAAGQTTAIQVVTAWMNSTTGHREAILSSTYCDIGVGYAYEATSTYNEYWVQNFGRKQGVSVCPGSSFPPPTVTTLSASNIQDTGAVFNGSVNPNGLATNYFFQYGPTSSYGSTTTATSAGSGNSTVAVSAAVSGLKSGTTYHYRLAAGNSTGTSYGTEKTFTTSTSSSSFPVGVFGLLLSNSNSIFSEKFDQDPSGWTKSGLWQWGQPNCGATSGHTGANAYSYNLTGFYENNLGLAGQYLKTPAIDCSGRNNVHLRFWRWLAVERNTYDYAAIDVSNDGIGWVQIWSNPDVTLIDTKWEEVEYDISTWADNQATVYIRWRMGPTDINTQFCGWNIDDVELYMK